ncbi:hypothetical protein SK224_00255 [Microbacterium sp. BG28]|uniref:hypothetical protein n=1 Tax=Microbacterium sp. BG28 TaxID=3097356 RepID=UPI002A5A0077|nr:hypothetical protein [Microbacterium sp. BG28]MDY0827551.1 hypothetical protein [Microbacterium sp. BG28]
MTDPTLTDLQDEATWLEWREGVLGDRPFIRLDRLATTEQSRAEFLEGARLLRLDKLTRAGDGGHGPTPIQLVIADLLEAAGQDGKLFVGIGEPRRTTKTTSVQCVLVGRCRLREDYQVGWTMLTTGAKAGERFRKDIVNPVVRIYPDPRTRPFLINVGKGTEHIDFRNGSFLNVYTPNGAGFRSGGFDVAFVDEGAEGDPELVADINSAVIPTMDTKIGAQFIVAGTGGKYRTGNLLHSTLTDPEAAVAWHGIPETTPPEQVSTWEPTEENPGGRMRELIELTHPGVGYTTPLESVRRSFNKQSLEEFLREYGLQFGLEGATDRAVPAAWWERAGVHDDLPEPPPRFCAFLKVHHDGTYASLGVAFEYSGATDLVTDAFALDGEEPPTRRAIALWHHQEGTRGLEREVLQRIRRRRIPLVVDNHGHTAAIADKLEKTIPKPKIIRTRPADVPRAAVELMQALEQGTVVQFNQPILTASVDLVVKQAFGQFGTWRFGAPKTKPDHDTTPVEAVAGALRFLDDLPRAISPSDVTDWGTE